MHYHPHKTLLCATLLLLLVACQPAKDSLPINTSLLSDEAQEGAKIFREKECTKCHTLGKSVITVVRQSKEVIVPDLTNPFIATDSSYVQTHLKFVEKTDMPPVPMNSEEIRLVSLFVAELHAATHGKLRPGEGDARCPVCNAGVLSTQAKEQGLWFQYLGSTFYFECEACKKLFAEQPQAFTMR